jgi:hypothetical protein
MKLAVGIDVGWTASKSSTGVVILDRRSKSFAPDSVPIVNQLARALDWLEWTLDALEPEHVTFCVDGPFAKPADGSGARLVERFFSSGPFWSGAPRKLRLSPAPTGAESTFLRSTKGVLDRLEKRGHSRMSLTPAAARGEIVEIFPTLFIAAMLPPYEYKGSRRHHSDDLWSRLIAGAHAGPAHRSFLQTYASVISDIEAANHRDRHDLRAAAISAIAADWYADAPPGSPSATAMTFIGHPAELGFLLPPASLFNQHFLALLTNHWNGRGDGELSWVGRRN